MSKDTVVGFVSVLLGLDANNKGKQIDTSIVPENQFLNTHIQIV